MLLASWGSVSDALCAELMRFDAFCHPDPTAFDRWAQGGDCPYTGVLVQRAANFTEVRKLWVAEGPMGRPYELMTRLIAEKAPNWAEDKAAEFKAHFDAMVKRMAEEWAPKAEAAAKTDEGKE